MSNRFRLVAPEPDELDIHQALASALDKLLLPPAVWCTLPIGHVKLSPAEVTRLARIGLKRGWPDTLLFRPGHCHAIELKRAGGRLSKTRIEYNRRGSPVLREGQVDVFPKLAAAGITIAVCQSVDAALTQIAAWGYPLRGHDR